jgi:hypothetical protein
MLSLYADTHITVSALLLLVIPFVSLLITELKCELKPYDSLLQKLK